MHRPLSYLLAVLLVWGCNPHRREVVPIALVDCPTFSADSAYLHIEQQLANGPRIPGTEGHAKTGDLLVRSLESYGFTVSEQKDTIRLYDDKMSPMRNIIARFGPGNGERILLCAHWDSRPVADRDTEDQHSPIEGANDNASGVAVLMEVARLMAISAPAVGVDMVFFDVEDQGRPAYEPVGDPNDHGFCMGSKYWAENLKENKYRYGVLLDMVGAKDAVFTLESISYQYAKPQMLHLWDVANQLGHGAYFQYNRSPVVTDDHKNINELANIPCMDIIQHDASSVYNFGTYWHTHADNLQLIDRATLTAVGQTLLQTIYNEPKE